MQSSIRFEEATEDEEKWLREQLRMKHFGTLFLEGKKIIIAKGRWNEIYAVDEKLYAVYKRMRRQPYSLGLQIGEGKRELKPALPIAKYCRNKMSIRSSQENHITYGGDPAQEVKGVLDGDFVVMVNGRDEPLGYGKVQRNRVKNIKDIGWYLREGG
ncbi:MAG: hypothetical protein ABH829_05780 [archaeon]